MLRPPRPHLPAAAQTPGSSLESHRLGLRTADCKKFRSTAQLIRQVQEVSRLYVCLRIGQRIRAT